GGILIASDNVAISGSRACTITQPNGQNIQTAIYVGAQHKLTFEGFTLDWNEENQSNAGGQYYTGIRSSGTVASACAGATDIMIREVKFTRGGNRAVDLRGVCRVWTLFNQFYKTGVNVASDAVSGRGNSLSIDVAGNGLGGYTPSYDTYCIGNQIDEH